MAYVWDEFPESYTANFEVTARGVLNTWRSNAAGMEAEIVAGRNGEASLLAAIQAAHGFDDEIVAGRNGFASLLAAIQDAKLLNDGQVTYVKLDYSGTLSDGDTLVFRSATGKLTVEPVIGGGTDTYQVKLVDSGSGADYLGNLLGDGLEVAGGLLKTKASARAASYFFAGF